MYPKLRFKEFDDAWEQRKLGEIGNTYTGLSGKVKEDFGHGEAKYIPYTNIFSNEIVNCNNLDSIEIDAKQNCVKQGDVFFTTSSETPEEVGMSSILKDSIENTYLNSFCFGYRPSIKFNLDFLAYVLRAPSFRSEVIFLAQGISRYNISKKGVMNIKLSIPSLKEQDKIGEYFNKLDNIITLHQRKCEALKKQKQFFLQNMFPKVGEFIPRIRFKNFDGDWKSLKLKEIIDRVQGNDGRLNIRPLTISAAKGWMSQEDRFSANIAGKELKNYTLLKKSELSYNHGNSKIAKYGAVFELRDYEEALVPKVYHSFRVNDKADAGFLEYLFSTKLPDKELGKLISSGARMDGLLNITYSDFSNINVVIPNIEEQRKIRSYFRNLDNLITLHQRQYEQLVSLKKYLLSKMFI